MIAWGASFLVAVVALALALALPRRLRRHLPRLLRYGVYRTGYADGWVDGVQGEPPDPDSQLTHDLPGGASGVRSNWPPLGA